MQTLCRVIHGTEAKVDKMEVDQVKKLSRLNTNFTEFQDKTTVELKITAKHMEDLEKKLKQMEKN